MSDTFTLGTTTLANDLSLPRQARTILAHLESGKRITQQQATGVYQIARLSDCILKIRNAGHDVLMTMCTDESGHKYGSYKLAPKAKKGLN